MTLELSETQVMLLQELIFEEIDRIGGYDALPDELDEILEDIKVFKRDK